MHMSCTYNFNVNLNNKIKSSKDEWSCHVSVFGFTLVLQINIVKILHCVSTLIPISVSPTDLDRRSRTSYTAPCNDVVSHGAPIGGIRVFADHTRGNRHKQKSVHNLRVAFHAWLSSRSDRSKCRWHTHLTNHGYFDHMENPEYCQLEPHARRKMAPILESPF